MIWVIPSQGDYTIFTIQWCFPTKQTLGLLLQNYTGRCTLQLTKLKPAMLFTDSSKYFFHLLASTHSSVESHGQALAHKMTCSFLWQQISKSLKIQRIFLLWLLCCVFDLLLAVLSSARAKCCHSAVFIAHFKPDLSAQCIFLFSLLHNSSDSRTDTNQNPMKDLFWHSGFSDGCSMPVTKEIPLCPTPSLLVLLGQENSLTFSSTLESKWKKNETYYLPDLFSYLETAKKELQQPI